MNAEQREDMEIYEKIVESPGAIDAVSKSLGMRAMLVDLPASVDRDIVMNDARIRSIGGENPDPVEMILEAINNLINSEADESGANLAAGIVARRKKYEAIDAEPEPDDTDADPDPDDIDDEPNDKLSDKTVAELKEQAAYYKLPVSGTKAELIKRIEDYELSISEDHGDDTGEGGDGPDDTGDDIDSDNDDDDSDISDDDGDDDGE